MSEAKWEEVCGGNLSLVDISNGVLIDECNDDGIRRWFVWGILNLKSLEALGIF
jgi:hypothetical protein